MGVKRFATVPNETADKVKLLFNCIYFYHDSNLVWFDYFCDQEPRESFG